jgi:hypothetical protein
MQVSLLTQWSLAEIIDVTDDAFQYSKKFQAGFEANAGK